MIEMQKLREGQPVAKPSGPQGRLTISDIKLPLKSEFMSRIGTVQGVVWCHFNSFILSNSLLYLSCCIF
jgi:hypothetical protein